MDEGCARQLREHLPDWQADKGSLDRSAKQDGGGVVVGELVGFHQLVGVGVSLRGESDSDRAEDRLFAFVVAPDASSIQKTQGTVREGGICKLGKLDLRRPLIALREIRSVCAYDVRELRVIVPDDK
jgi:hypothetical protein